MSKLCIYKDVGFGDERKVDLTIDLSLSGKVDSEVRTRLVVKDAKDDMSLTQNEDMLHIHICDKFSKKSVTSEKGEALDISYVPFFIDRVLNTDNKVFKANLSSENGCFQRLLYCDLLFIAVCLDACERTCKTVFPWYIGGSGSAYIQDGMLQIVKDRKDFNAKAKSGRDIAQATSGYVGGLVGTGAAGAAGMIVADGIAAGTITTAGMATSAGVMAGAVSSGATALAGGAGVAGAVSAGAATFEAGASAAAAFGGVAIGAAAMPVTLTVAATGLTIMAFKGMLNSIQNYVLKENMEILLRYSELVQRGNIGLYCAKNELRFHEIWTELADKCEALEASDIFDLEKKITELL